jgi:hypothetical protein
MAKLMLIGNAAHVELTTDPEDGQIIATCVQHSAYGWRTSRACNWTERYRTVNDAEVHAGRHADQGE